MPLYSIKDTKTNEVSEVMMKYDDFKQHLADNPHIERVWDASAGKGPQHFNDVRHQLTKKGPGEAFNNKLKAIAKAHKGSTVNYW